jgi:hypothetical protein
LEEASNAGVPWAWAVDHAMTDEYRRWLAHEYISRAIGVDPLAPPTILGPVPTRPADIDRRILDSDLDALGDFTLQPLQEFAQRGGDLPG